MEKVLDNDLRLGRSEDATQKGEPERECIPLRECTKASMQRYFADLNGCKTGHLHAMVMREVEQPLLESVMQYTRGNQSEAAKILGLNRSTLRKKLRNYDLNN